jgi:hypothetical protein
MYFKILDCTNRSQAFSAFVAVSFSAYNLIVTFCIIIAENNKTWMICCGFVVVNRRRSEDEMIKLSLHLCLIMHQYIWLIKIQCYKKFIFPGKIKKPTSFATFINFFILCIAQLASTVKGHMHVTQIWILTSPVWLHTSTPCKFMPQIFISWNNQKYIPGKPSHSLWFSGHIKILWHQYAHHKNELRGLSSQANYADWVSVACQRS